jgi:hypothetical protein
MSSQPGRPATAEQATGTKGTTYALVSVLDHALQGAAMLGHDLQDAEAAGAQELVQFLREAQAWQRHLASQAQQRWPKHPLHQCRNNRLYPACLISMSNQAASRQKGLPACESQALRLKEFYRADTVAYFRTEVTIFWPGLSAGRPPAAVALWRGAGVESRRHNLAPDPDALTRLLPACWEVCRMPRRTSGQCLSSPPTCSSLSLSSVRASLALHHGALTIPLRRSGH